LIYTIKKELGVRWEDLGGYFGGRDRTTIMHSVEACSNMLETCDKKMLGTQKNIDDIWKTIFKEDL
jgi:chromosomal replication initiation ATPase DnaA